MRFPEDNNEVGLARAPSLKGAKKNEGGEGGEGRTDERGKGSEGKASYTTTFSQYFTNPIKNIHNTVSSVFSDIGYSDSVIRLLLTVTLFQIPIN